MNLLLLLIPRRPLRFSEVNIIYFLLALAASKIDVVSGFDQVEFYFLMNVKFNASNLFSFSNFVLNSFIILFSTLNCNLTSVSIAAIYGLMQKFNILKHGHYTINQQLVLIKIQCMAIYYRFSWMSFQNFWELVKRLIYFISKFSILWLDYFNLNFLHKFWVINLIWSNGGCSGEASNIF